MKKLVFICTGNTCRSPMAQGLFIKYLKERSSERSYEVVTAGLNATPGERASPEALTVMEEVGIDLSAHRTQTVTEEILLEADLILTMTKGHRDYLKQMFGENENLYSLYECLGDEKDVKDPYGWGEDAYRACRDELEAAIKLLLDKLQAT